MAVCAEAVLCVGAVPRIHLCLQFCLTRVSCAEEKSKQPTAKPFTAWADAWKAMEPTIAEAEKGVLSELEDLRKMERCDVLPTVLCVHLGAETLETSATWSAGH